MEIHLKTKDQCIEELTANMLEKYEELRLLNEVEREVKEENENQAKKVKEL